MRPTRMEVNLQNFRENIRSIKSKLSNGTKIMPVIKANAYGTYLNTKVKLWDEFDIVAVAIVQEGIFLRKLGYKKEIFILNQPDVEEIDEIVAYDLTVGMSSIEFMRELGAQKAKVKVHLEIGTGMGRTGIHPERTAEFLDLLQGYDKIEIEGIYSHMSCADTNFEYTKKQIASFERAVKVIKEKIPNLKYIHMAASNGVIYFPEAHYNLVRPGMILYGYPSGDGMENEIQLKPVCRLKSKVTFLKTVKAGTSIGYGRSFVTARETKVATIAMGYADGLRRDLSNRGEVLIHGKRVPIIGKICMDSFMADVTEVENVKVGSDVWIWDNQNIMLEEIAEKCHTIHYEIMSGISERVPRIFIENA